MVVSRQFLGERDVSRDDERRPRDVLQSAPNFAGPSLLDNEHCILCAIV